MRKLMNRVFFCLAVVVLMAFMAVLSDNHQLKSSLIRFHVVANSDSQEDQNVKLLVRDAVLQGIEKDLASVSDVDQARAYLQENLPKIESIANTVLRAAGFEDKASVSLCREAFDIREYDTFSLPSGVYEALRIVIGEGEGKNWWCVSFPGLCLPATSQGFVETAAEAGFSDGLTASLTGEQTYEIHFFLLDVIGRLENSWFEKG